MTPDVIAIIKEAAADPESRKMARLKLAELITEGDLLADYPHDERRKAIYPSEFGSCGLALWAEKHGLADIPRDPLEETLARLDLGSLIGAWEACLLWAGCRNTEWWVILEYVPDGGGHIDALACHRAIAELRVPIEFKSTYSTPTTPIKDPSIENYSHLLQVGDYAQQIKAEHMILVYIKPPAKAGERMRQFVFDAEPFAVLVVKERERLAPALGDAPPIADPQAGWACFTCGYGKCEKNKNKNANSADVLFA